MGLPKPRRDDLPTCDDCGQVHQRNQLPTCAGHKKDEDGKKVPCLRWPIGGGDHGKVCRQHGGSTAVYRTAVERRKAEAFVEGKVKRLLREADMPDQHPLDGLLEMVRHSGAMFRVLGGLVGELDVEPGAAIVGVDQMGQPTLKSTGLLAHNRYGEEVPGILVQMYGTWADRYARACKLALDAGIDERLVRNAELATQVMFTAVSRAMEKANLEPAQVAAFRKTLAQELRQISGPV